MVFVVQLQTLHKISHRARCEKAACALLSRSRACAYFLIVCLGLRTRDTRCNKSLRHVAATGCCNKSPRVTCENHSVSLRQNLSPRSFARIQTSLNSYSHDKSQRQYKRKQPCRSVCTHLRQIAATKFKSTNEGASISFPPC